LKYFTAAIDFLVVSGMVDVLPRPTVIFSTEVSWLNYRIAFAVWMVVFFLIPEEDSIEKFAAAEHRISGDF
jgi:hypothetical protein